MKSVDLITGFDASEEPTANIASIPPPVTVDHRKAEDRFGIFFKYLIDAFLALIALVALLPLITMVSLILLATQGAPILIAHRRIGKRGVPFHCFKFRTMVKNSDEILEKHLKDNPEIQAEWNASRKLKKDPRVTAFGRSLRRSSIDELPQLLNVLRGDMSLVGPRPITQSETLFYGPHIADYIAVRPGLTGLWQVSGRSETSYSERVEIDVRYVAERSLVGDFVIMAKTIPAVLSTRGSY
ncbi:sugar transferase [Rhizobium sp. L51/94]|uniref:sugar transferase n=1 Tax=Rhizobium sp. L51/94 TaxID=2819999 RepID=UPI001C5ACED0|nr:sugar transferase [Rhizobium sp. L51/94]QXZ80827.1 sugar transferase [Rhizobium sp. L51/94]